MKLLEHTKASIKVITPDNEYHYFFGYYDLLPYSEDGRKHLCHRVKFMDRFPEMDDIAELGEIDIKTREFNKLAETTAWNFQQGAMLTRYGKDSIIFNRRNGGGYESVILNTLTGKEMAYPAPCATSSFKGKIGLSINFNRIYDFRPGYGYCGNPDKFRNQNAPENDGVSSINFLSGEVKLLVSYKDMCEQLPQRPYTDCKLLVNHITLNPRGDRFVLLLRNFSESNLEWKTELILGDMNGNIKRLTDFRYNSHYCWRDNESLLIVSDHKDKNGLWLFNTKDGTDEFIDIPELEKRDIHCIYSPDNRYIIGDGYPYGGDPYRPLYLYNTEKEKLDTLVSVYSFTPSNNWDIRCDLHARFRPDGKKISFDTLHNGKRQICEMDLIDGKQRLVI